MKAQLFLLLIVALTCVHSYYFVVYKSVYQQCDAYPEQIFTNLVLGCTDITNQKSFNTTSVSLAKADDWWKMTGKRFKIFTTLIF